MPGRFADDPFIKFAETLREFETGESARIEAAGVRVELRDAIARRERGDLHGALAAIGRAMARLAGSGGEIGSADGKAMREITRAFMKSLRAGLKET